MQINKHLFRLPAVVSMVACLGVTPGVIADDGDITDRDITIAIETDLFVDDAVPSHRIDVMTDEGVVTLSGYVGNILAKERALERATSIKGVHGVVNRIKVDAVERSDRALRKDVKAALFTDPATDTYELDIEVANGVVTLKGSVDSWQEKQLAATVTRGVGGVKGVKNEIDVDFKSGRSDYEISTDIEQRLAMSVWVDTAFLNVDVKDGKVTLSGSVGSEIERRRAAAMAWVAGVTDVSADRVEINWWAKDEMKRKKRFPVPADDEIAEAVEATMVYDPRVFSFNVDVDVASGVATLTGTVDNLKAKHAAGQNAENTVGVWRVRNHLRVRPVAVVKDMKIAAVVRDALARDPYVDRFDVNVEVIHGRAYLSGTVNTSFEYEQAEDVASRVNGVIDVDNNITYEHTWTRLPDQVIRDDVIWQLYWSPFVDSRDINVEVEDGVVTLTGEVEDWSEWHDAMANAFEGHAKDVRNKLKVVGS